MTDDLFDIRSTYILSTFFNFVVFVFSFVVVTSAEARIPNTSEVEHQEEIFTRHHATYRVANNSIEFYSNFTYHSAGEDLRLDGKSNIKINDREMGRTELLNTICYYSSTLKNPKDEAIWRIHSFEYTDNNGEVYRNEFRIPFPINFSLDIKNSIYKIAWQFSKDQSQNGDHISYSLNSSGGGAFTFFDYLKETKSEGERIFTKEELLEYLKPGRIKLGVCRWHKFRNSNVPRAGGELLSGYCAKETEFDLR